MNLLFVHFADVVIVMLLTAIGGYAGSSYLSHNNNYPLIILHGIDLKLLGPNS